VRDDREAPLFCREKRRSKSLIYPTTPAEYFCPKVWTDFGRFARRVDLSHRGSKIALARRVKQFLAHGLQSTLFE
jgi:hypothetical protein